MSVTVSAVPFFFITSIISAAVSAGYAMEISKSISNSLENDKNTIEEKKYNKVVDMICREYDTVFVDKDVLLKTMNEYGFDEIEDKGDQINCKTEGFIINFYKTSQLDENNKPAPYKMYIKTDCSEDAMNEFIAEIGEQYSANTQEESYKKIKERLKKHNLKINEEEVLEDNSIVLTINVD